MISNLLLSTASQFLTLYILNEDQIALERDENGFLEKAKKYFPFYL